ncbi:MAG TPA: FtsX-like permease family protein [Gammaproteobacteria bacterium]
MFASVLAGLGLYGVLAYGVAQRAREIGLRFALGAPAERIRAMVLRQVGWTLLIGAALGVAAAVALGRSIRGLLFGVAPVDVSALVVATGALVVVALAAAYLPLRRALAVEPSVVLRDE